MPKRRTLSTNGGESEMNTSCATSGRRSNGIRSNELSTVRLERETQWSVHAISEKLLDGLGCLGCQPSPTSERLSNIVTCNMLKEREGSFFDPSLQLCNKLCDMSYRGERGKEERFRDSSSLGTRHSILRPHPSSGRVGLPNLPYIFEPWISPPFACTSWRQFNELIFGARFCRQRVGVPFVKRGAPPHRCTLTI